MTKRGTVRSARCPFGWPPFDRETFGSPSGAAIRLGSTRPPLTLMGVCRAPRGARRTRGGSTLGVVTEFESGPVVFPRAPVGAAARLRRTVLLCNRATKTSAMPYWLGVPNGRRVCLRSEAVALGRTRPRRLDATRRAPRGRTSRRVRLGRRSAREFSRRPFSLFSRRRCPTGRSYRRARRPPRRRTPRRSSCRDFRPEPFDGGSGVV